jgi:hypothetical protein
MVEGRPAGLDHDRDELSHLPRGGAARSMGRASPPVRGTPTGLLGAASGASRGALVIVPASADVSSSAIQHDDAAVELMRERFDRLFAGDYATGIRPDEVNWVAGRDPDDHTRQICNGWKADPEIARQVLAERTGRLAAELMRWDGVQILQDNCIWKPPKTSRSACTRTGHISTTSSRPR